MQKIKFTEENYGKVLRGKRTTIRLGTPNYKLGHADPICNNKNLGRIKLRITEIRIIKFKDIGLSDAVADGFNSINELMSELKKSYGKQIVRMDDVTIIRFIA